MIRSRRSNVCGLMRPVTRSEVADPSEGFAGGLWFGQHVSELDLRSCSAVLLSVLQSVPICHQNGTPRGNTMSAELSPIYPISRDFEVYFRHDLSRGSRHVLAMSRLRAAFSMYRFIRERRSRGSATVEWGLWGREADADQSEEEECLSVLGFVAHSWCPVEITPTTCCIPARSFFVSVPVGGGPKSIA